MIKTKANVIKILFIVLLSLLMMTGGIVFLCSEVSTPPAQMEEQVDEVKAATNTNYIHWTSYGAGGKIGSNFGGYVWSGYAGAQNYRGGFGKTATDSVGTESRSLTRIAGQSNRGIVFDTSVTNYQTGLSAGFVKISSDGTQYAYKGMGEINGTSAERGGINYQSSLTWDVYLYYIVNYTLDLNGGTINDGASHNGVTDLSRFNNSVSFFTATNTGGSTIRTFEYDPNISINSVGDNTSQVSTQKVVPILPVQTIELRPTKRGYTWYGWYTGSGKWSNRGTQIVDTGDYWKINRDSTYCKPMTLYAQYEANTYTLTANANGGSIPSTSGWSGTGSTATKTVTFDASPGTMPKPTRTGYTFAGWYTSTSGGTKVANADGSFIASVSGYTDANKNWKCASNATLYAHWTANNYNLKIDPVKGSYNNTTNLTSITQNYGTSYTYLTPTRTGYNFDGWHTGQNYLSSATTFNGSSTYVAIGRSAMYTDSISVAVRASMDNWSEFQSSNMRLVSCTESGGWNFEPSGEYVQFACYDSGVGYKSAKSGIKWSELSSGYHTFVGTFDGQYATIYIDGKPYGVSGGFTSGKIGYHASNGIFIGAEAGTNATTPAGNYFKGTIDYVAISNIGTVSKPATFTFPAYNSASTAQWTAKTFTLTFDGNGGGTPSPTSKTITYDSTYGTLATVSRTGYTFNGWWTAATGGSRITENTKVTVTSNQTLYAHWTVNNYTVTWNGNGASLDAKLWSYAGSTGYTSSNSGSNSSYTYSGKNASSSVTYDVAISYKTPIPFKLGNTFNGWWTSASGGYMVANTDGQVVASVSGYTDANKKWIRAQATTLYAQWTQQSYSISYNLNGGSLSSQPNSYTFGTSEAIGIPTRTGHTFAGWTVTSTLTGKAYATINLSSGVMEFSNSYPTAVYFPLFYQRPNVSYSGKGSDQNGEIRWRQYSIGGAYLGSNSGSSSEECMTSLWYHGGMNSATTTITWNQNAGFYTIPSNQTGDLALVARWNVNSYTLTAKANSGSIPSTTGWTGTGATATKTVTYNAAYDTLPVPTKTGYGFAGWWTQASGGTQVSATTKMGAADTTIYAHWTINSYTLTADCYGGTAPSILPGEWTANGQKPYLTLNYQSEYGTLPEPTRQGYIFAGWFTAASAGSEVNSSTKMGAADATIYAHWVESWVKYMSSDDPVIDQADGYYKIDSAAKLARLAYLVNSNANSGKWLSLKYKQTADIDLSAHYWQPIGNATYQFKGIFDGTTFDIHNMKTYCGANAYSAYNSIAMFAYSSGATIKNVNNYDVNINGNTQVGGIATSIVSITIQNCKVSGTITGTSYVGGIAGYSAGDISDCENYAMVSGGDTVGGLVGYKRYSMTNCANYGNVKGNTMTGGLVGNLAGGSVNGCVNQGNVTGQNQTGGIAGIASSGGTIQSCVNDGTVQGTTMVGGIVGYMHTGAATILNGLNTGTLKATAANSEVGGIAGRVTYATTITSSFVDCSITPVSTSKVGGIVGYATVAITITYCGAKVNVTAAASTVQPFYTAASGVTVTCNDSYSLVNNKGTQINRITATNSGMDGKFGMIPTIHDGLPVPLGIYHTSQYGTTTGIASTLKGSQYGCITA